ncbi:hypothetical protein L202_06412 [Cryptococcus amylolentus CBS 6039]|uniref:Uncharacterized protein n=2 Tax=Cryptococcus amylolentus TaxID=104669 RepID=A0A1E3HGG7_9TREE|nr:hypothetical protein L202_06412 [Cryptococcus amylolentus CBS 6039]ODN75215.1 hypothetical protein L202_06412 [Cryptococcus amylolentus CBS 6039]ODO02995.1 hypothetical protein I350_05839 [Cryptococcus amylolentus CBS 6273]
MEDSHFHLAQHDHIDSPIQDETAEALIASLKAVINNPNNAGHHQHAAAEGETHEGQPDADAGDEHHIAISEPREADPVETLNSYTASGTNVVNVAIRRSLSVLFQLTTAHSGLLEELNGAGAIHNLAQNLKALKEGNKRQVEMLKELTAQIRASEMGVDLSGQFPDSLDSEPSPVVLRTDYEALKAQHDALVASTATAPTPAPVSGASHTAEAHQPSPVKRLSAPRRGRPSKAATQAAAAAITDPETFTGGATEPIKSISLKGNSTSEGRKKRSLKLEHLIHKMANRRLGVEYAVSNYESKGNRTLPDPESRPLSADESPNGVSEFRPNFQGDVHADSVRPFVDQVVEDVWDAWQASAIEGDAEVDKPKIKEAMNIYWLRLMKRWEEQEASKRGEIHRDQLSRRKQNTYRRQQSLLMRRTGNFDQSPLNECRLRAHYRTLLTIDFSTATSDRPEPDRQYSLQAWEAYRRLACGPKAGEAHEVLDQWWQSPVVRHLLILLDEFSQDQIAQAKKKGKPKQPNPTFHLPPELWMRTEPPALRPKDANGLPLSGAPGLVLFRFHVSQEAIDMYPEWAKGLYDNPPIPAEDEGLPTLAEILSTPPYARLRHLLHVAKARMYPKRLDDEQIAQINSGIDLSHLEGIYVPYLGTGDNGQGSAPITLEGEGEYMTTFAALSQLASNSHGGSPRPELAGPPGSSGLSNDAANNWLYHSPGPSTSQPSGTPGPPPAPSAPTAVAESEKQGSSQRARRLGKRMASEVPGGAVTPVAKHPRRQSHAGMGMFDVVNDDVGLDTGLDAEDEEAEGRVTEVLGHDAAFLEGI